MSLTYDSHHPVVHYTSVSHHSVAEPAFTLFGAQITAVYTFLVVAPFMFEKDMVLLVLNAKLGNNALWLGIIGTLFMVVGAAVGAYLSKMLRNTPRVIGVGLLLVTPFEFAMWNFLDNSAAAAKSGSLDAYVEAWFWTGLCLISLADFGFGAAYGGTLAYLGKSYRATLNANTGKVMGSFFFWMPLSMTFMAFIAYLIGTSLVWGIIVAVLTVLVALVWLLKVPTVLPADHHLVVDNEGTVA
jgi:hypothetical protein